MPPIKVLQGVIHPIRVNGFPQLADYHPVEDAETGYVVAVAIVYAGQRWDIPLKWIEDVCYEPTESEI